MILYLLYIDHPKQKDKYKIGITNNIRRRLSQIRSNGGAQKDTKVYLCCNVWFFAKTIEQKLIKYYAKKGLKYTQFKGSGYSEWIAVFYPFRAVFVLLGCKLLMLLARISSLAALFFIIYSILIQL